MGWSNGDRVITGYICDCGINKNRNGHLNENSDEPLDLVVRYFSSKPWQTHVSHVDPNTGVTTRWKNGLLLFLHL